jgi:hypothetical protein
MLSTEAREGRLLAKNTIVLAESHPALGRKEAFIRHVDQF